MDVASHRQVDTLRRQHKAGIARYGDVGLSPDAFATAVRACIKRRLDAVGLDATSDRVTAALARLCGADLYLAQACEAGCAEAWSALDRLYTPRLLGLAIKQGADRTAAEDLVTALLADLALPSGPKNPGNTLIGTYRGTGSLFGWLAMILVRRIAGAARRMRPASLDVAACSEGGTVADGARSDPARSIVDRETTLVLERALRGAWDTCTPREQLALVLKFRDERAHRWIADVLRVGVPRVSQLLAQALAKLGTEARQRLPDGIDPAVFAEAAVATRNLLATLDVTTAPTPARRDRGGAR